MYALFSVIRVGGTFTLGSFFRALKAKETPYITGKTRPIYALNVYTEGWKDSEWYYEYYSHNLEIGNHRTAPRSNSGSFFVCK